MQIHNAIITGSFSYNGADLSNVTSSNAYSASLSSRTTDLESTSSVLVGASSSFSSILSSVSSSQQQISASLLQVSASYIALSGSYNTFSGSASTRVSQIEQVYATTGSNSFRATQSITGSLVVSSTITAQTLVVQTVTSSIVYSSGSNNFGNQLANTQTFTGSVNITGSTTLNGVLTGTSATFACQVCASLVFTNTVSTGGTALTPTAACLGYGIFGYSGVGLGIASSANGPNQGMGFFVCGDVERMRIITSGNVGIGTLCPSYLLDVNGTIRATGAATFASSVTATTLALGSVTPSSNGIYLNVATANGANYGYIRTNCLTVNTTQLILGSTYGYNTPVDALTIFNGSATLAGLLTVNGFGSSAFSAGGTGYNKLTIRNTTAGVANGAQLSIGTDADADQLYIQSFATTFTTSGMNIAGGAVINGEGPGGLSIAATQACIGFYTNGAAAGNLRMAITCAGNVVVGNPAYAGTTTDLSITGDKVNSDGYYSRLIFQNSNQSGGSSASIRGERMLSNFATDLTFYTNINTSAGSGTEKMRIRYDGVVLIGQSTTSLVNGGTQFVPNGETYHSIVNSLNTLHVYDRTNSVYRFYVTGGGTINATNTTISAISDVRLKENIVDLEIGLDAIMSLRPRQFDWKKESGNSGKNVRGFIAQEFEQIFPDLIDESINPAPEGEEPYKQVRQDLIPVLVKGMQEQQCTICSQASMINQLKTCLGIN